MSWQKALEPTPHCIPLERLGETLTDAEREHVASCARCQAELALFNGFQHGEETPEGQWIATELQRRLETPSNVKVFTPRRRFTGALAAAAAAVIVIGSGLWMQYREPSIEHGNINIYRSARLEAIAPNGDLTEAPKELRWTPVAGATSYSVRLLEVDRTPVWSAETQEARIALPASVAARCLPGKTLMWDVTARRGSEAIATSDTQQFRVSPTQGNVQ